MQENDAPVSLSQRERNQRDTWNAVHDAAFFLARDEGLSSATVETIASRAGVSRRTFFNYFPSKEDAILGTRTPRLDDVVVQRLISSQEDELTRTVHAFVAVLRTSLTQATAVRRREILAQHPGLRSRLVQLLTQVEGLAREAAERAGEARDEPESGETLEVLLLLSGVITKHAFGRYYAGAPGSAPPDDGLDAFLGESIALFRKVIEESR